MVIGARRRLLSPALVDARVAQDGLRREVGRRELRHLGERLQRELEPARILVRLGEEHLPEREVGVRHEA